LISCSGILIDHVIVDTIQKTILQMPLSEIARKVGIPD